MRYRIRVQNLFCLWLIRRSKFCTPFVFSVKLPRIMKCLLFHLPGGLMRGQACIRKENVAAASASRPKKGTSLDVPSIGPKATIHTPALSSPKASQAGLSSPRDRQKRGNIQKPTPIASCAVQPNNRNSICAGNRRQIAGWRGSPLCKSSRLPSVNPSTR